MVLILILLLRSIKVKIWVHAIAAINRRELLNKVVDMSRIVLLLSEHISAGGDLFDQYLSLLPLANLDALLNYVVAISILHHGIESAIQLRASKVCDLLGELIVGLEELVDDLLLVLLAPMLKALLYYIASEFVVAQLDHAALDTFNDPIFVFLAPALLQDVLDHIVAKLVLSKSLDIQDDRLDNRVGLGIMTFLEDSLNNSATIGVKAQVLHMVRLIQDGVKYKVNLLTWHFLNAFLDDMISVLIINTINDGFLKLLNKQLLLFKGNYFESFLYYSAAIHRLSKLQHISKKLLSESGPLEVRAILEELLHHVVSEDIIHQGISFR